MSNKKSTVKDLAKWIESVDNKLDNHLISVTREMTQIANDVSWLKRFFWVVASVSVAAIIGLIIK